MEFFLSFFDIFSKWMIGKGATTGFRLFIFMFCVTIFTNQLNIKESIEISQFELTKKIDKMDVKLEAANVEYNSWARKTEGRLSSLETLTGFGRKSWRNQ